MKVNEVMTKGVHYVSSDTTIKKAAEYMRIMDYGFLPVGDDLEGKLSGVITDRDIAIRAVAEGKNPMVTTVCDAATKNVIYCFAEDELESAARKMAEKKIKRLVVLKNKQNKTLCGVITVGDIVRHNQAHIVFDAAG